LVVAANGVTQDRAIGVVSDGDVTGGTKFVAICDNPKPAVPFPRI